MPTPGPFIPPDPVDFPRVLVELAGRGYGVRRVADCTGVTVSTVKDWMRSSPTRHCHGCALIELWPPSRSGLRVSFPGVRFPLGRLVVRSRRRLPRLSSKLSRRNPFSL
jgi:hypothetical protein